jgi:hypothetical protein
MMGIYRSLNLIFNLESFLLSLVSAIFNNCKSSNFLIAGMRNQSKVEFCIEEMTRDLFWRNGFPSGYSGWHYLM